MRRISKTSSRSPLRQLADPEAPVADEFDQLFLGQVDEGLPDGGRRDA
jgi:hypothetical protein